MANKGKITQIIGAVLDVKFAYRVCVCVRVCVCECVSECVSE